MPRVNLLETDKLERRLKGNIQLIKGNRPYSDMAKQMGLKNTTARNRLVSPLKMTVKDLYLLCLRNHVDVVDVIGKELKIQ